MPTVSHGLAGISCGIGLSLAADPEIQDMLSVFTGIFESGIKINPIY